MIERYAQQAADNFNKSVNPQQTEVFINPATILLFTQILSSIIAAIKACGKTGEEVKTVVSYEPASEMRQLKRIVRRQVGFFKWWWNRKHYLNAVMQTGRDASPEEIQNLLNNN